MRHLAALISIATWACAAPPHEQAVDSARSDLVPTGMPGPPASGMVWDQQQRPTFCERPVADTGIRALSWPDSASAVLAAKRALGSRLTEYMDVGTLARTNDGILLQFHDRRPGVLDGSASVYVSMGPCVTILGW